ncbi:MAG: hypothetical protein JW925_10220, partial [Syntrophaceae bacterium]|nr:hypothetical protein [Syntrophaceae bacterium]
ESIKKGYSVATLPSWVKTQSDFHIWEFEADYGVPAKEHKKLTQKERILEEKYKRAVCEGRAKDAEKLYAQKYEAGVNLARFMGKYLKG